MVKTFGTAALKPDKLFDVVSDTVVRSSIGMMPCGFELHNSARLSRRAFQRHRATPVFAFVIIQFKVFQHKVALLPVLVQRALLVQVAAPLGPVAATRYTNDAHCANAPLDGRRRRERQLFHLSPPQRLLRAKIDKVKHFLDALHSSFASTTFLRETNKQNSQ